MEKLEVGDRVKFVDDAGVGNLSITAPLGTEATVEKCYQVDGYDHIDVAWDGKPMNGHRWLSCGFLAERFRKLYPLPGGSYTEQLPEDVWDPRGWF